MTAPHEAEHRAREAHRSVDEVLAVLERLRAAVDDAERAIRSFQARQHR